MRNPGHFRIETISMRRSKTKYIVYIGAKKNPRLHKMGWINIKANMRQCCPTILYDDVVAGAKLPEHTHTEAFATWRIVAYCTTE